MTLPTALLAAGCGASSEPGSEPSGSGTAATVDVAGTGMWIQCEGEGSPTVILEAGLGNESGTWHDVMPEIAAFTHVCRYDRAGLGFSDDQPERTVTSADLAETLHSLLSAYGVEPPYVLVGHSMGGAFIRLFTAAHPEEVQGLVLEDSVYEDQFCDASDATKHCEYLPEGNYRIDALATADELRASGDLGGRPVVVLSHGQRITDRLGERLWTGYQAALARLSTDAVHVIASHSGHYVHEEQLRLFVEAVREDVDAARSGSPLPPCEDAFPALGGECV